MGTKAEYFYNVKNGSSIITSKSSSKNLSNEYTSAFVVFKTKRELKCQFSGNIVCLFSLLRFFEELFDVRNDNPFLKL